MRLFTFIAIAALIAGCGSHVEESPRASSVSVWDEGWRDAGGSVVQEDIASTAYAECVNAVLLYVGWPLGTPFDTVDPARMYVRDPEGTLDTVGPMDSDATLPKSARNTGYHLGEVQLWLGKVARKAAYLVEGSKIERWPRLIEAVGCV